MDLRTLLLAGLSAAPAAAQTFIVDVNNGPGTNFTSIAAAVAAVPDGATLLVRPGTYNQVSADVNAKAMTILGSGQVLVGGITIRNTGPAQSVAVAGLSIGNTYLTNCAGPTTLQANSLSTFTVDGCAQLFLIDCQVQSPSASTVPTLRNSTTLIHGGSFLGSYGCPTSYWCFHGPGAGLSISGGATQVSGATIRGGDAGYLGNYPLAPAISIAGGDLRILDGIVEGGRWSFLPGAFLPGSAVSGTGNVRVDPETITLPALLPVFDVTPAAILVSMPSVSVTDAFLGGVVNATVRDPVGELAVALIGLPGPPVFVPGIADAFWLDPAAYFFQAIGTAPLTASQPVPVQPALVGFVLGWQGVTYSASSGLQASIPVRRVIR